MFDPRSDSVKTFCSSIQSIVVWRMNVGTIVCPDTCMGYGDTDASANCLYRYVLLSVSCTYLERDKPTKYYTSSSETSKAYSLITNYM